MKKHLLALTCVFPASLCYAELTVTGGDWQLQPNLADQQIATSISGDGSVTNATIVAEIQGDSPLPIFTGGDIVNGTIFESNNTGAPSYDFSEPQLAYLDVATDIGSISISGTEVLAILKISTIGLTEGTYTLALTQTTWGDSYVGTTDPLELVQYANGTITIVPEPSGLGLVLMAVMPLLGRCRRVR